MPFVMHMHTGKAKSRSPKGLLVKHKLLIDMYDSPSVNHLNSFKSNCHYHLGCLHTRLLFLLPKQSEVFLSFFCATYVFTCQSRGSLAEFPECWAKPAAEPSMSTSDAFTVLCSQPSEYFQTLISMAAAFSLIPGLCSWMCACRHTHTHTVTYLYPLPTAVESSCLRSFCPVGFLPLIYSTILFPLWLTLYPCLFSNYLFSQFFLTFNPPPLLCCLVSVEHC